MHLTDARTGQRPPPLERSQAGVNFDRSGWSGSGSRDCASACLAATVVSDELDLADALDLWGYATDEAVDAVSINSTQVELLRP